MKTCKLEGCEKPSHTKGICGMHKFRMLRHGSYKKPKPKIRVVRYCKIKDCNKIYYGKGYCNTHWASFKKTGDANNAFSTRHNMTYSPEWYSWSAMITRCTNKNHEAYSRYGGRGINVCSRWLKSFSLFYKDMGKRPKNMSIDRIDNNSGYNKENCKWSTRKEQCRNKSNNVMIEYKNNYICLAEYCEITGIKRSIVQKKINEEVK